jgi:hypothetical protein
MEIAQNQRDLFAILSVLGFVYRSAEKLKHQRSNPIHVFFQMQNGPRQENEAMH